MMRTQSLLKLELILLDVEEKGRHLIAIVTVIAVENMQYVKVKVTQSTSQWMFVFAA